MPSASGPAKQPVSAVMAGPYGHPYHPMLVAVPIGAWVASLVFDIGSHLSSDSGALAQGSVWLIAIGVVGALAAASTGFLDLLAIPTGTRAFRTCIVHMSLNLLVTVCYVLGFVWRLGDYGQGRAVGAGQLALSVASLIILSVAGFLGGRMAYRYGVRVADESTQHEGFSTDSPPAAASMEVHPKHIG